MRTYVACPWRQIAYCHKVVQFVFLKTSLSTERSVLKISALGHFDQSVRPLRFRTDFTINEIVISTVHKPSVLLQTRLKKFSSFETGVSYPCCQLCQICARSCYKTGWPTPNGSWTKLNDPPFTKGSKTESKLMTIPLSAPYTPNTFWPVSWRDF